MLAGIRRLPQQRAIKTFSNSQRSSSRAVSTPTAHIASKNSLATIYSRKRIGNSSSSLTKWESSSQTSLPSIVAKRSLHSSSLCATKKKYRKTIHSSPDGTDRLENDEQFARIMEEQKLRVAQLRAQEKAQAAEADVAENTTESVEEDEATSPTAKEARKALIAKMIAKHVPLNNTDQAIEMFNMLIQSFVRIDSMEDAQEVYEQMLANDLPPNRLTYNLLARGYSRHSPPMIERLQRVMNTMVEDGGLDVFTFNALILSYSKLGQSCNASEMFTLMRSHNVVEDISTCNLLLSTYSRIKDQRALELTEALLEWMKSTGIQPNSSTYTHIINACQANHSRAMDFYEASLAAADAGEIPATGSEERLTAMLKVFGNAKQLQLALNFMETFLARYPSFQLTPANHGALFYLNIRCLHIKSAFDDLDAYLATLDSAVPGDLVVQILAALRTLPEATLTENEENLNEWAEKLTSYPSKTLEAADAAEFRLNLLHWRKTYIPVTP